MTDAPNDRLSGEARHTSQEGRRRLRRRYAAERRFRLLGLGAVLLAVGFLVLLLSTIVGQAIPTFTYHYLTPTFELTGEDINPRDPAQSNFDRLVNDAVYKAIPFAEGRSERRAARGVVSETAPVLLREQVLAKPGLIGGTAQLDVPVSDTVDLYLKGLLTEKDGLFTQAAAEPSAATGEISLASDLRALPQAVSIAAQTREPFGPRSPSFLAYLNGGVVKLTGIDAAGLTGEVLVPLQSLEAAPAGAWRIVRVTPPEALRQISDREIAYADHLSEQGLVESQFNWIFFTRGASREPELAGIWGAVVGSFLTLVVTLVLSFPLGVAAAVYLEEFAPKNRWTDLIEVNINNLAAVPSIVFGLLGLALFLNFADLPRSAPLVGGMVLALMTLPTIIIASRAALKAVPPSIREAALAVGASKIQTIFHHVLPLAMPGIMTGTIIGMAQALGETAPLLMIGMVAFIVDVPSSFTEPATVLPVQIFMWADFPEAAFRHRTAAAILVLLAFLVAMNALAVVLRRRFERRW